MEKHGTFCGRIQKVQDLIHREYHGVAQIDRHQQNQQTSAFPFPLLTNLNHLTAFILYYDITFDMKEELATVWIKGTVLCPSHPIS
jgi:hypothetical protein